MDGKEKNLYPQTEEALIEVIRAELKKKQTYNSIPETIARATFATFNYVVHQLNPSGAQAGFADLLFLKMSRGYKLPFAIIKSEDLLYPQYDILGQVQNWLEEWRKELKPKAQDLLDTTPNAHPNVRARWEEIANQ